MRHSCRPNSYFEAEAPKNGFGSPLAQAAHHMWKRDAKVHQYRAEIEALHRELGESERELEAQEATLRRMAQEMVDIATRGEHAHGLTLIGWSRTLDALTGETSATKETTAK